MKRIALVMVVVLVVAGGVGYLATRPAERAGAPVFGAPSEAPIQDVGKLAFEETVADAAAPSDGAGGARADTSVTLPTSGVGPRVIKTAFLTVEVKDGEFQDAFEQASMVAERYDGFIVSSSSRGEKTRSGDLLIRVPSPSFELAMRDLRGLGETESESVDGQEVTDQFIDLNARLRSWEAQQRVLLRLMDQAKSISETMTVQRELQQVQAQIEQIKGQLRVLRDQTSFATIQLALHEPGAVAPKPVTETPSLADAWAKAWAGFLSVVSLVIVGLGYLIPLAVIGLGVWLAVWLVLRRRPRATATI